MSLQSAPRSSQEATDAKAFSPEHDDLPPKGSTPTKKLGPLGRYVRWLHTKWPAGTVEPLPEVQPDGSTNVPGLYVVGDLTGIPLLKFSADTGARAVQRIISEEGFRVQGAGFRASSGPSSAEPRTLNPEPSSNLLDLAIIGAGVSGMAAALEAKKAGLSFEVIEATEPFSTLVNFPKAKPIYTYPTDMTPAGDLQFHADVKEALVDEVRAQTIDRGIRPRMARVERVNRKGDLFEVEIANDEPVRARRVIVSIGRSGNFRKLGCAGEERGKVYNRLYDPKDFAGKNVLVVGGGDSALETAIAVAQVGGHVTICYRKAEFSRPKPDNVEKLARLAADPMADVQVERPVSDRVNAAMGGFMSAHKKAGSIRTMLSCKVKEIREAEAVVTDADGRDVTLPNDAVFTMIGREAPLDFFRRSGVNIRGEWRPWTIAGFVAFLIFSVLLYHWKSNPHEWPLGDAAASHNWFPANLPSLMDHAGAAIRNASNSEGNLLHTLRISASGPAFYYTLAYCTLVVVFGVRRIKRRKTPYVKWQTISLILFQCIPLFLLPEIILPWMGHNGWFNHGPLGWLADQLFPAVGYGNGREYWRAYGFILAWPLFVYNAFTSHPLWLWLAISAAQTFVLIPGIVYFWGKGAYCGWVCSCGALAETLGDQHRQKMPHGPLWNRVNMVGQAVLLFAGLLMFLRVLGWLHPTSAGGGPSVFASLFEGFEERIPFINYHWFVDILLAGIVGVGFYFWFSGRVWCRFACPLAALMHIYARFGRFRILADKKKCISCNVCTSVCHQGIDVMNFANKGMPMEDPECVRCSACVQSCPTGVLSFGQIDRKSGKTIKTDPKWLIASPVQMVELKVNGKALTH